MSGIYIHIPFCKQACSYCDFYFITQTSHREDFINELIREIQSRKDSVFVQEPVQTIYFGGGTPSLLSPVQVHSILTAIDKVFELDLKEVTLEMNPDDVSEKYLNELKSAGINRASMGVQTFDEQLLKFMNRAHTSAEAYRCLEALSTSGINVYTADLIYGNPGQTSEALEFDIERLLEFDPPHVSAYSLTIEPRTRLGKQLQLGRLIPPEEDLVADHFDLVEDKLRKAGIRQYEVSNFARPGSEAVHNSNYWAHENYLGFGPGAHSFWWGDNGAKRWSNEPDLINYLKGSWKQMFELEELGKSSLAEERLMLGLRTVEGISLSEMKSRYGFTFTNAQEEYLYSQQSKRKLVLTDTRLRLTKEGLRIADAILLDLITR